MGEKLKYAFNCWKLVVVVVPTFSSFPPLHYALLTDAVIMPRRNTAQPQQSTASAADGMQSATQLLQLAWCVCTRSLIVVVSTYCDIGYQEEGKSGEGINVT